MTTTNKATKIEIKEEFYDGTGKPKVSELSKLTKAQLIDIILDSEEAINTVGRQLIELKKKLAKIH